MEAQLAPAVDGVLVTPLLWSRPPSSPRWKEEAETYSRLARQLARDPKGVLELLVNEALQLCFAGSAGVSLLERQPDGRALFRWVALAGQAAPFVGGASPRDFSPCGICVDKSSPTLFSYPARCFSYFSEVPLSIVEGLVLPLATKDEVFGTIWILSHEESRHFDSEDARVLQRLGDFAMTTLRLLNLQDKASCHEGQREELVRELQRSNLELSRFSHMVAHDLQTSVRTVRTFVELLIRKHQGDGDDQIRSTITGAADKMHHLIRSLLAYAEVGNGKLNRSEFNAREAIDAVTLLMTAELAEAGARIECGPLPVIEADRTQIQQLFQNLIGNGIKYRRTNEPPVLVISGTSSEDQWSFSVEDNGMGIEPQYQDKIFQPMQRLHGSDIPGSGLGLATCALIVDRHQGKIFVRSQPGTGTTFSFTLQRPKQGAASPLNPAA